MPSQLLAAVTSNEFTRDCLSNGLESWERPEIYSVNAWLKICSERARYAGEDIPALLSVAQEQVLWRRIIQERTPSLFDIDSTAELAVRAARVIAEWHIPLEHEAWNEHEDGQQYRNWLHEFRETCRRERWTTSAELWRLVPGWITSGLCGEQSVIFAGFGSVTPALLRLRHALGASAIDPEQSDVPDSISVQSCGDLSEEIDLAARGSRFAFERNSEISIGVLVPDLPSQRGLVERIFERIFYPAAIVRRMNRPNFRESESVFHVHAAPPLSAQPPIAAAMLLIHLAETRIPVADAGAILRSSWITGAAAERNQRALADLQLRRSRELDVSFSDLHQSAKTCPLFQELLRRVRYVLSAKPLRAELAGWSEFFSDIIGAAGWPGDAELTAEEREFVELWKDKLSQLAALSIVGGRCTLDEAFGRLTSLLAEPGSSAGDLFSPIQIIDATYASGLRFDQTFVTGVSEENTFLRPQTSPLIPFTLQRACGVPGANPASDHALRGKILRDILSCGSQVFVSYSKRVLPAAEALLRKGRHTWPVWEGRTPHESFSKTEIETLEDAKAPPYTGGSRSLGGTGLIKDQSQCPFRAFAGRRLNARCPEEGSFGLDSRERGGFVHEALKSVWDELKSQRGLIRFPGFFLPQLVEDAVQRSIRNRKDGPLHEQLSLAETERLTQVILDWLQIERYRKQPFDVELTEQKRQLHLAGLQLDIRIDRVDRLKNGRYLLVDYKSGDTKATNLNGDRPREPQLLAYAAAMRDEVDGVFFAQLKPRNAQMVGYGRHIHSEGQKPAPESLSWDEYLEDRIAVVQRLAEEFVAGEAAVNPIREACTFCDFAPLCRINEIRRSEGENNVGE